MSDDLFTVYIAVLPLLEAMEAEGILQFIILRYFFSIPVFHFSRLIIKKSKNIIRKLALDGLD